ncbi:MAG: ATP-binding protein [Deltaproteobacteria bacterium]|nr:ATP-binding protein [Deltaproteobacteria bacterium]
MALPAFLSRTRTKTPQSARFDSAAAEYRPLLGSWLIRMALMLKWHEPKREERWPDILGDSDFLAITGIEEQDTSKHSRRRPTANMCKKILLEQLEVLEDLEFDANMPLFKNIAYFAELLKLSEASQAYLLFAALIDLFPSYRDAIGGRCEKTSNQHFQRIMSGLTGIPEKDFMEVTVPDGILTAAGLLKIDHRVIDLESKIDLIKGLSGVLLSPHATVDELMSRFLRKTAAPTLTLENFPHLAADTSALRDYVRNAVDDQTTGVNILFSGKPGVGKTQYGQALAAELGVDLYEIAYSDSDGDPIKGESRLRAYSFCQRLLADTKNAVLLFDEVEDIFPQDFGFLKFLFGGDDGGSGKQVGGKAWINRTMELNPVPAIWISNHTSQIDHAYRRRFDYSINFPIPPKKVRLTIAEHHLNLFDPPRDWLERIASNEEMSPGQLERAAKVASVAAGNDTGRARELVDQTLQRSITLLDQRQTPTRNRVWTCYNLDWLNINNDINRLIDGLKKRPHGTFCFYGAAGTGKSELARHMADELGVPVIIRRASDLLDKYVGESEKNISAMFDAARQQNALLILDEADSFLSDRRGAQQSWEVTQVNELLTQMEAFDGIFVCTTNLMDKLDQASLRRFSFKIRFDVLKPEQRWGLFCQELERLGGEREAAAEWEIQVKRLEKLTPGDFSVANRQFELLGTTPTAGELYEQLRMECEAKGGSMGKIGFGG